MTQDSQEPNERWIHLGSIARPHGIKGAFRVHMFNRESEALRIGQKIQLRSSEKSPKKTQIDTEVVKTLGNHRVFFECVKDRTHAESFRAFDVYILRDDLEEEGEDELYLSDFIDAEVYDTQAQMLGSVHAFSDNGFQVLVDVVTPQKRIVTLPFVPPILQEAIDAEGESAARIVLDPPEGFFDDDELSRPLKKTRR